MILDNRSNAVDLKMASCTFMFNASIRTVNLSCEAWYNFLQSSCSMTLIELLGALPTIDLMSKFYSTHKEFDTVMPSITSTQSEETLDASVEEPIYSSEKK